MDTDSPNIQNNAPNIFSEFTAPTPPPEKKSKRGLFIILAVASIFLVIIFIIVIVANSSSDKSGTSNVSEESVAANKILGIIAQKDFAELPNNLTKTSPFNAPGFSIIAVENTVGSVNFETCKLVVKDSYDTSLNIVESISTEITYLPYECDSKDDTGKKIIELDMQKAIGVDGAVWKLNYIVKKEVQT